MRFTALTDWLVIVPLLPLLVIRVKYRIVEIRKRREKPGMLAILEGV